MRQQNWFIRNLDDLQREVIIEGIDKSIIVQGPAGSGKTNLAIHRAFQAKGKGTYAIVIMTQALKRMISYGMEEMGLDNERIAYEWAWQHRGFDLIGDVFCRNRNNGIDMNYLYLVNKNQVRKFKFKCSGSLPTIPSGIQYYGLDFVDWVPDIYYRTWYRRQSWFVEDTMAGDDFAVGNPNYRLVPGGTMYIQKKKDERIDYLIIDEAQDFNVSDYRNKFIPLSVKSISLLGDSNQVMSTHGASIQQLKTAYPTFKSDSLCYFCNSFRESIVIFQIK